LNPEILDRITLVCPRCRRPDLPERPDPVLKLHQVKEKRGEFIFDGTLICSNPLCRQQYPIIQGVPCILRNNEAIALLIEAQSADQSYPHDALLSTYLDACYESSCIPPRVYHDSLSNAFFKQTLRSMFTAPISHHGIAADLGCSVGWFAFELAAHHNAVIGIDTKFSHLAVAAALQRGEEIVFQRPLRSLASESVKLNCPGASNLCFILADALDPPLTADSIDFVSALNLIDSISHPLILLGQMDAMLRQGGKLLVASPFTWNRDICPESRWIEDPETTPLKMLKELLKGERMPENGFDYLIVKEELNIPWTLPVSDNHLDLFKTQIVLAAKRG
jgi:SAM-dependent methyltransferase